jgi:hypothetical protein
MQLAKDPTPNKKPGVDAKRGVLRSRDSFGTTLLVAVVDEYGLEALNWEPEMLTKQLEEDFRMEIPSMNADKLHAVITALTGDSFYQDAGVFWVTANTLNNQPPHFESGPQPLDADAAVWAVLEIGMLDMKEDDATMALPFSDEVGVMLGIVLKEAGIRTAPNNLDWVQFPPDTADGDKYTAEIAAKLDAKEKEELSAFLLEQSGLLSAQLNELKPFLQRAE